MYIGSKEISTRLKSERERTGLTVEQFSALSGVTVEAYRAFESGDLAMPFDFVRGLKNLDCDPAYIHLGERKFSLGDEKQMPNAAAFYGSFYEPDQEFQVVVNLLRRSVHAVDAFVGSGASQKSPELVAAVINATIFSAYTTAPGEREDLADKVANAISELAEAVRELRSTEN